MCILNQSRESIARSFIAHCFIDLIDISSQFISIGFNRQILRSSKINRYTRLSHENKSHRPSYVFFFIRFLFWSKKRAKIGRCTNTGLCFVVQMLQHFVSSFLTMIVTNKLAFFLQVRQTSGRGFESKFNEIIDEDCGNWSRPTNKRLKVQIHFITVSFSLFLYSE